MKLNVIRIWKFEDAPKELRLSLGATHAEWIAFIPKKMWGDDLAGLFLERTDPGGLSHVEMPNGDMVYAGMQGSASLAASFQHRAAARIAR